jgi:hypothetical protein
MHVTGTQRRDIDTVELVRADIGETGVVNGDSVQTFPWLRTFRCRLDVMMIGRQPPLLSCTQTIVSRVRLRPRVVPVSGCERIAPGSSTGCRCRNAYGWHLRLTAPPVRTMHGRSIRRASGQRPAASVTFRFARTPLHGKAEQSAGEPWLDPCTSLALR